MNVLSIKEFSDFGDFRSKKTRQRLRRKDHYETRERHEKVEEGILYKEESYKIIGACFEVYKDKGSGFLENVYQECLAIEFEEQSIPFIEKPRLLLEYKGRQLKQTYEPDFICFGKVIVEIKSVKQLCNEHRSQTINYLKSTGQELALLVNFGHYPKIESERFINQRI